MNESYSMMADQAVLGKLLEEHRPRLLAMLSRRMDARLAKRYSAEDIYGDACLNAHRRWAKFKEDPQGMTSYAWLYGIARSCLLDRWREASAKRRDVQKEMPWPDQSSFALGIDLGRVTTPTQALARKELAQRVQETLAVLKEKDREILSMRYLDDLTFPEISQLLKIEEGTARVRYVRALKRLKDLWQQLYPHDYSSLEPPACENIREQQ